MNPRIFKGFAALALLVSVSACVTDEEYTRETYVPPVQMNAFLDDKPAMARKFFANIPRQGIRNEVLNHQRASKPSMPITKRRKKRAPTSPRKISRITWASLMSAPWRISIAA